LFSFGKWKKPKADARERAKQVIGRNDALPAHRAKKKIRNKLVAQEKSGKNPRLMEISLMGVTEKDTLGGGGTG